ncbi:MAG: hypothetical protein ACR2RV_26260 [Verrucomicrobiales bacterium]
MNRNWLVHSGWLVLAVAAFAIGSLSNRDSHPSSGADRERDLADTSQLRHDDGQAELTAARSEPDIDPSISRPSPLSEDQISSLGEKIRSSNPLDRRRAFSDLLEGLNLENALLVRKQIEHLGDRSPEYREFHYAWGAIGGVEAVLFGADTPGDDMAPALGGWASTDPQAAFAWLEALDMENDPQFDSLLKDRKIPAGSLRTHLLGGLVAGMASTDPTAASQFVHKLVAGGDEAALGTIHRVVATVLHTQTPAEAAAWAGEMSDERLRRRSMDHVAAVYAAKDFDGAKDWAIAVAEQPDGAGVVAVVGSRMAHRDPQSAMTWLNELPAGQAQNAGAQRIMREWTDRDPTAASDFLADMPESPSRDSAITGLTQRLAREDPQSAVAWAETITSDATRQESLIEAGRAWQRRDPAATAEWLATANLPESAQEAILAPADKR